MESARCNAFLKANSQRVMVALWTSISRARPRVNALAFDTHRLSAIRSPPKGSAKRGQIWARTACNTDMF
eukprot:8607824-Alexandrium_andersonii.AAC.1